MIVGVTRGFKVEGDLLDLEVALMCRRFNVLPSQIFAEDAYWIRRSYALVTELDRVENMRKSGGKKGGKLGKQQPGAGAAPAG